MFTRAASAPPVPQQSPKKSQTLDPGDIIVEEDEFNFQSSSLPPEEIPPVAPRIIIEPALTVSISTTNLLTHPCPGVLVNWELESSGWTFPWHRVFPGPLESESFRIQINSLGVIKYTPHPSIETQTLDLSVISYNLGGCKLLYVMSHVLCLPSLRTLRRHMAFTRVMPTIGTISVVDIIHNIKEVVLKPRDATGCTKLCRASMMIDEVALEERACHSTLVDLVLKTYEGALALAKAIKDGKVHLAKEMTVVVVSCFGESGTYLILALPSCKHVNAEDSGTIYKVVTATWDTLGLGADKVGPIWSWATDSDMRHRVSGYKHFLAQTLYPTSPIYGFYTLLHSPGGIAINNGRLIMPTMLARFLVHLPGQTPNSIHQLLFPHGPQDVPHAIELMKAVVDVGSHDFGTPKQITSLSTFTHLSFIMHHEAWDQYLSNQLYGNSQSVVKNDMLQSNSNGLATLLQALAIYHLHGVLVTILLDVSSRSLWYHGIMISMRSSLQPTASSTSSPIDVEMTDTIQESDEDDEGDGITFEESLKDVPELELLSSPGIVPEDYILVNGKWVHKQRICQLVISQDFEPKSIDDTHIDLSVILGKDVFVVGDPILTLLKTGTNVSLAVLHATAIHQDGKVKITGQVHSMSLVLKTAETESDGPMPFMTATFTRGVDWLESEVESKWAWIWNREYLKVESMVRGTSEMTDKVILVSVPGVLTELVNPTMSWEIDDKQLGIVSELLWGRALEKNIAAITITVVKPTDIFPYHFDNGKPALLSHIPTQQLVQDYTERENRKCKLCGQKCQNQRVHIGMHILRKLRGIQEELTKPVGCLLLGKICPVELLKADLRWSQMGAEKADWVSDGLQMGR
ncbi:hypothetical protein B0H10DRAFT_1948533 [Mycena sp. CBHHK59/15]|nr:hypothetical protein B0H10DRAFT_1948533 [Mycena sp. CBHHK59/15]